MGYKRPSTISTAYFEINLGSYIQEVKFTGKVEIVDNGIGSYECHGYRGNDVQLEPECEEFEWDKIYTPEEDKIIEKWVEDNDLKVIERLIENANFDNE